MPPQPQVRGSLSHGGLRRCALTSPGHMPSLIRHWAPGSPQEEEEEQCHHHDHHGRPLDGHRCPRGHPELQPAGSSSGCGARPAAPTAKDSATDAHSECAPHTREPHTARPNALLRHPAMRWDPREGSWAALAASRRRLWHPPADAPPLSQRRHCASLCSPWRFAACFVGSLQCWTYPPPCR